VTVNYIIENAEIPDKERELLKSLPLVQTGKKFFARLRGFSFPEAITVQVGRLQEVFEALSAAGLQDNVFIDLGITRDFEYYTGIVFEAYTPALGFPICGSGRYNNLYSRFGMDCPATGFALGIERILLVLERFNKLPVPENRGFLVHGKDFRKVLAAAADLRSRGHYVKTDIEGKTTAELEAFAKAAKIDLIEVGAGEE
jgi:ATP phosphoribosyltransferase regulatory subunit